MAVDEPMNSQPNSVSLAGILDANADEEINIPESQEAAGWDEAEGLTAKEGYCVECEGAFLIKSTRTGSFIQRTGRPAGPTAV
jgi:hypothetical protein